MTICINVCFISGSDLTLAASRSADIIRQQNWIEGMKNGNIKVHVISNNEHNNGNRYFKRFSYMIKSLIDLMNLTKSNKIDLVFTSDPFCIPQIYILKKLRRLRSIGYDCLGIASSEIKISGIRNLDDWINYIYFLSMEYLLYNCADFFITINNEHKNFLKKHTDSPIYVVRDSVDVKLFDCNKANFSKINNNDLIVVFIGSLIKHRLNKLFHIVPKLIKLEPNVKILIIGSGNDLIYYLELSKSIGLLNKNIFFTGNLPHDIIPKYLCISDIAYSDIWSGLGFPMKVYEYMASGKAIVVDDTASSRETLNDGIDAMLVSDETELLEKLLLLARDKSLRLTIGTNARKTASNYLKDETLDEFIRIIKLETGN